MSVTAKLLSVFKVDKQFRGLRSRLSAAEKFLAEQVRQIEQLDARKTTLETQCKQVGAAASNFEGEVKRLDARMETLRTQMNSAQTNKEYKAFLTEVNTLKAERDRQETLALEQMGRVEDLKRQIDEIAKQKVERERVRGVAQTERDQRAAEIRDQLESLDKQRRELAADIPADAISIFERLIETRGDEAMAPIEEVDRKRHEYHCNSCMMALPIEAVNGLLVSGKLTRCSSCQCILYIDETLAKSMREPAGKR